MATTTDIKCPNCGVWLNFTPRFCYSCGYEFSKVFNLEGAWVYHPSNTGIDPDFKDKTTPVTTINGSYQSDNQKIIELLEKILKKLEQIDIKIF